MSFSLLESSVSKSQSMLRNSGVLRIFAKPSLPINPSPDVFMTVALAAESNFGIVDVGQL